MFLRKGVCLDILKKEKKLDAKRWRLKFPDGGGIKAVKDNV